MGFFSLQKESFIGFYFSVVPRIEEQRRTLNQQLDDQQLKNLLQMHYRLFCLIDYLPIIFCFYMLELKAILGTYVRKAKRID